MILPDPTYRKVPGHFLLSFSFTKYHIPSPFIFITLKVSAENSVMVTTSIPKASKNSRGLSEGLNPKTNFMPNQAGYTAKCAVAARPISSLLPASSIAAKPAAISIATEIKKLKNKGPDCN